jgi:hypothetical protein
VPSKLWSVLKVCAVATIGVAATISMSVASMIAALVRNDFNRWECAIFERTILEFVMVASRHTTWPFGFRGGPESADECRTKVGGKPDISELP